VGAPEAGALMGAIQDFASYVSESSNWWGDRGILHRSVEHMRVSLASLLAAGLIAVPAGVLLGHVKRGGVAVQAVVNIGRAVPSYALLALLFPLSLHYGFGLGFWPTLAVMVLLAVQPMFTNSYIGVRDVDPAIVEASRGMGLRGRQVLLKVEVPIATPLILTGVRIALVQVIATATLGGLFGLNALGSYIFEGFAQSNDGKLYTGAVFVAILAILTEVLFSLIAPRATPWTRRRSEVFVDDDVVVPMKGNV